MRVNEIQKAEKFRQAAVRRVRNVETTLRRVKNWSNSSSYEYTDQEIDRIFEHLQSVLDVTRESFARPAKHEQFSL